MTAVYVAVAFLAALVALATVAAWLVHCGYLTITARRPARRNTAPKEEPK